MNGAKKFHNPNGPAFNKGELWKSSCGLVAEVKGTNRWGEGKWDVDVYYTFPNSKEDIGFKKNAWSFQVRYQHIADEEI